jgi:hypothetical protein
MKARHWAHQTVLQRALSWVDRKAALMAKPRALRWAWRLDKLMVHRKGLNLAFRRAVQKETMRALQ